MIKNLLAVAKPITNPALGPGEGDYDAVINNPLGPLIVRLWWTIVIVGGLALLVFFIWGGIDLLTSEGNKEKYENARNKLTHAIMGMALLAASYAIIQLLNVIFGFNILKLSWPTPN